MKSIYLIMYDNGEDYEDNDRHPVLAAPTKERAEEIVAKLTKWVERAKKKMPEVPDYADPDVSDEENSVREVACRKYAESLKPPHGITELVHMATYPYGPSWARLYVEELFMVE